MANSPGSAATLVGWARVSPINRAGQRGTEVADKGEEEDDEDDDDPDAVSDEEPCMRGETPEFAFDTDLCRRFWGLARPYFVPDKAGKRSCLPLLAGLTCIVASMLLFLVLLFLLVCSHVSSLAAIFPDPGKRLRQLTSHGLPAVAILAGVVGYSIFWTNRVAMKGKRRQWVLLGLLVSLLVLETGISICFSFLLRSIENVLVAKDMALFMNRLEVFIGFMVVATPCVASRSFVEKTLAVEWREFLTTFILDRYFRNRMYYLLDSNSTDTSIDNPDQRLVEDINNFTHVTLEWLVELLSSAINTVSFVLLLWSVSGPLILVLLAYAGVGTVVALLVGGKLIGIQYKQLQLQADFRYSLVHVRDNAEAIAFYQGEARERDNVVGHLGAVVWNFKRVVRWTCGLIVYQQVFYYAARLLPWAVLGRMYISGAIDFGTMGQSTFAFHKVLLSVTLIVQNIQSISTFSAGVQRLGLFYEALVRGEEGKDGGADSDGQPPRISTVTVREAKVELSDVSLRTPTGRLLVEALSLRLAAPDEHPLGPGKEPSRLLICGSSGLGKSSILRAVAGLWTRGGGRIVRPPSTDMLFLPQKPYMPLGDLRTQLVYPEDVDAAPEDDELVKILAHFGLADLPSRFPEGFASTVDWSRVLSLGEQQRLAATRCLVSRPKLAVLDEATSALPVQDEGKLYRCLQELGIGYISVGHRLSLLQHHDAVLELLGAARWRIVSPKQYEASSAAAS